MNYIRPVPRILFSIGFMLHVLAGTAQTLGGSAVFSFLRLSAAPQQAALGGVNLSQPTDDPGMAFQNPALLHDRMHTRMHTVFNDLPAGVKAYHLSFAYHARPSATTFLWGLHYMDYGSSVSTDAAGNLLGRFRPVDWMMQLSASHAYRNRWTGGLAVKFIHSRYGIFRSSGLAADLGLLYRDTARGLTASVLLKNAGGQIRKYLGSSAEELPFDLHAGITRRLQQAPVAFSITAQRIHRFDIRYNDTLFNTSNGQPMERSKRFSLGKVMDHLILGTTLYIGDRIECQLGYNFLRRRELNIANNRNGLNGFSAGVGARLGKLELRYARAHYQSGMAFNQLGLTLTMNRYLGLGKWGERIGW
ncbi:MAG: type secretion system protein PorQ [Bacteroidota bacterium]|jgi:hypothetical protein